MAHNGEWNSPLSAAWASHPGCRRDVNEDRAYLTRMPEAEAIAMVVLDGIGGHGGGELASRIAVRAFQRMWRRPLPSERIARYEWMLEAFYAADEAIRRAGSRTLGLGSMGATAAAVLATPDECLLLHAGDCRVYHFSEGQLAYVTADHSVVRVLVDTGTITEKQVASHPMRSVVTSCLGGGSDARLTIDPAWVDGGGAAFRPLQHGDTILLCSDGLWSEVLPGELQCIVQTTHGKARHMVGACVDAAMASGARDNVTAAAICVERRPHEPPAAS